MANGYCITVQLLDFTFLNVQLMEREKVKEVVHFFLQSLDPVVALIFPLEFH